MSLYEWILTGLLLDCVILFLYFLFKEKVDFDEEEKDTYSLDYLCGEMIHIINDIINMDIDALNLNRKDMENRKVLKRSLSDAVRKCSQGNMSEKVVVFSRMKLNLVNVLGIKEDVIDEVIPFHEISRLTSVDMFEILMYQQKLDGNKKMFKGICEKVGLDQLKNDGHGYYYSVTKEDIRTAYDKLIQPLSYDDKLNIITQRIYEDTYGLSVADLMIMEDESLDSISGGVSGITTDNYRYQEDDVYYGDVKKNRTYDSVWITFDGKPIHMKFLSFKSNSTMIRICKNLSEHGRMGHITSSEGGLKTHLDNGSRVTIFRPNNATQWSFFVRKYGSTADYELENLITGTGSEKPVQLITWVARGNLNVIYSGDQNSGKTTNMRATIRKFDKRQPIRSIEADFELYLNDAYADMNILGTRPSEKLNFSKLIELLKSSEAHTILFGETASLEHAKYLIDLLLAGTKRVITTGHWTTSDDSVSYFVHSMGGYGSGSTQEVEALVSRLLHIDIHCVKENDGTRHIERITEIIPYSRENKVPVTDNSIEGKLDKIAYFLELNSRKKAYYTKDLIVYEDGEYHMVNAISEELSKMILRNLPPEDRSEFLKFNVVPERG